MSDAPQCLGMRALTSMLLAATASCQTPIWLLPELDRAAFVLMAGEGRDRHALAGSYAEALEADLAREGPLPVHLLTYDLSLEALGLEAGPIVLPLTGPAPCAAVQPLEVFELKVGDRTTSVGPEGWIEVRPPAPVLDALVPDRAQRCSTCTRFEASTISFAAAITATQTWRPHSAAWLDSGAAIIIGNGLGAPVEVMRATPDEVRPLRGCVLRGEEVLAIEAIGGNRFLIGRSGPSIARIAIDEALGTCTVEETVFLPRPALEPSEAVFSLKTQAGAQGLEVFALTSSGSVERYAASEWARLVQVELDPMYRPANAREGGLALNDRGELAAVAYSGQIAGWDRERGPTRWELAALLGDLLSDIAWVPALGWVVGAANGAMAHAPSLDGTWSGLGEPTFEAISAIVRFRDGMFVVQARGLALEWQASAGWCPSVPTVGATSNGRVVLVSADQRTILIADLLGEGEPRQPALLLWLRAAAAP